MCQANASRSKNAQPFSLKTRQRPEGLHPNQSTKSCPVLTLDKKETFEVDLSSGPANIKENLQIEKRELVVRKG
jgi:hypothetical protein